MSLFIRVCDTYELLREQLILSLRASFQKAGVSALSSIPVIVPNLGIGRDIRQTLAKRNGVDANVTFGYLAEWTWSELKRLDPNFRSIEGLQGDALIWRIDHYLGDQAFVSQFSRLANYLTDCDRQKRWQLATHIAKLFTRYNAYRLDWVQSWIKHEDPVEEGLLDDDDYTWQKALWERFGEDLALAAIHPAEALYNDAGHFSTATDLHVFIPQNVPPLYLRLLARLSRGRDVFVYLKNPCSQFWLDIRHRRSDELDYSQEDALHLEALEGHPLLASWARQTKAMYELFYRYIDEGEAQAENLFVYEKFLKDDYEPSSNLERLQHSIAKLDPSLMDGMSSTPQDRSLEIHSCYSMMREVEALQDYLYALFENDPSLKASDVLVVTSDIDTVAPMIDATFGNQEKSSRIEYRIQGRSILKQNDCASALSSLMRLMTSSVKASDVFLLLSNRAVSRHFGLENALDTVYRYFEEAGFREGMNVRTLTEKGLASVANFSFESAIDRLMLGWAKPDEFEGIVADKVSASLSYEDHVADTEVLASLAQFFEVLNALYECSFEDKDAKGWRTWLLEALNGLVGEEGSSTDRITCLQVIDRMVQDQILAEVTNDRAPIAIVRAIFDGHFADVSAGATPHSGVTFTNMNSLHGLSYRVICVLGLNEGVFPLTDRPDDFDMMARFKRAGDRQRMQDDRNTFFDLLMDAQDYFYVSFCGQSNLDGTVNNPSILIDEMLDAMVAQQSVLQTKDAQAREAWRNTWILKHPLHAFSLRNFQLDCLDDTRTVRRDATMLGWVKEAMGVSKKDISNFWSEGAVLPFDEENRHIRLDDLVSFWNDPMAWFWKQRLQLRERKDELKLSDRENYSDNGLVSWKLRDRYFQQLEEGVLDEAFQKQRAHLDPSLSVAPLSDLAVGAAIKTVADLQTAKQCLTNEAKSETCPIELSIDIQGQAWVLSGEIDSLYDHRMVEVYVGRLKAKHLMAALIRWAAWQCMTHESKSLSLLSNGYEANGPKGAQKVAQVDCYEQGGVTPEAAQRFLAVMIQGYIEGQKKPLTLTPLLALQTIWKFNETEILDEELASDWSALLPQRGQYEMGGECLKALGATYAKQIAEILGWG